jgi:formamidopyrimidine-DNA glycosylase
VPELPDLTVVAEAFDAALVGRRIRLAEAPGPLAVRGTPGELDELVEQQVRSIAQRGKFLVLELERDRVVINPMLTGRFQLADPAVGRPRSTALVLGLGPRLDTASEWERHSPAAWTRDAPWLPGADSTPEIRYRDPTQMGKVYLLPAGLERAVPGLGAGEIGPDADDPELSLEMFQERIRRHPGELKNVLRNQAFVAGIGNAYSDEILHAARLHPFRKRSSLAAEEVDDLYVAMGETLHHAIDVLRARVAPTFETQVRDFLAVHLRGGTPCPRCGTKVTDLKAGGSVTSFCRGCQG